METLGIHKSALVYPVHGTLLCIYLVDLAILSEGLDHRVEALCVWPHAEFHHAREKLTRLFRHTACVHTECAISKQLF